MDIAACLLAGDAIERRLGNVDEVVFDQGWHVAVEEGQKKRADVGSVDVGVRHDDDFMIAKLFEIKAVDADAAAQC